MKYRLGKKIISYLSVLLCWELAYKLKWLNVYILPSPFEVMNTFVQLIVSGELVIDALTSLWRVFVGFTIASVIGISLGVIIGINQHFKDYISPLIEIIRPIPPVAFIPLSVLWFGIGNGPAYFLVSFGAFFPIFTNSLAGILSVSSIHQDAALCLGASRRLLLTDVIFPASIPYLAAGLKTGLGTAWFCVIVAELVGSQSGLGYMIQLNRLTLQSEKVLSGMTAIGILGYVMNLAMGLLQRRAVQWQVKSL